MQMGSRLLMAWDVLQLAPSSRNAELVLVKGVLKLNAVSLLLVWSITGIVRYSFCMLKELEALPQAVSWLQYSTFFVLYPHEVSSELVLAWSAWTHAQSMEGRPSPCPTLGTLGWATACASRSSLEVILLVSPSYTCTCYISGR